MRVQQENSTAQSEGAYDLLYKSTDLLWPSRPGRMVAAAANVCAPGRALDLGCGDGKNAIFLERSGWSVDSVDVSSVALEALRRRFQCEGMKPKGEILLDDARTIIIPKHRYDLVICYGLYHCLNDMEFKEVHARVIQAVKPGGFFAFAVFNDQLPIPENHRTGMLYLRSKDSVVRLCPGWDAIAIEAGTITEAHPPLVSTHSHALTWGLLRKPLCDK